MWIVLRLDVKCKQACDLSLVFAQDCIIGAYMRAYVYNDSIFCVLFTVSKLYTVGLSFFTAAATDYSTPVIYEVQVPRHQIRGSNKTKQNLATVKFQRSLVPWTRPNLPPRQLGNSPRLGPHVIERTANPPAQSNFLPSLSLWPVSPRRRLVSHLLPPSLPPPPSRLEPPEP
jgi:hypothetical protein